MHQRSSLLVVFTILSLLGIASAVFASEHTQKFGEIEVTQSSESNCTNLRISYKGKLSHEQKLQAYVNLNGAHGIFSMERIGEKQRLLLTNCARSCEDQKSEKVCVDSPIEMRKIFYWASQNGKLTPWFLEIAFIGANQSDVSHDNYNFYFP